jgi:hypothetical protein
MKSEAPNDDQPTTRPTTRPITTREPKPRSGNRVRPFARVMLSQAGRHQLRASEASNSKVPTTGTWHLKKAKSS